ncbi:hypothetical protein TMatcc_007478 [Talaromyces marneffei ATCC 18224]
MITVSLFIGRYTGWLMLSRLGLIVLISVHRRACVIRFDSLRLESTELLVIFLFYKLRMQSYLVNKRLPVTVSDKQFLDRLMYFTSIRKQCRLFQSGTSINRRRYARNHCYNRQYPHQNPTH